MATFTPSTSMNPHSGKLQWHVRFAPIPHALLTHPTYGELTGGAAKLLLALLADYAGNNNGHLTATFSRMKRFGFNSKDSLARGLRELITFGYIVRTKTHHLRSPALYAVTWLPIDRAPAGQSYDTGAVPAEEAQDLWRHIDPRKARSTV
jgi:hypothetical protein